MRIPVFVNPHAGSAEEASELLRADRRFTLEELPVSEMASAMRARVDAGAPRLGVCGGDGTLATAAAVAIERGVELALIPGGTLNHFAKRVGIPTDVAEAIEVAAEAVARPVDVGFVNDVLFLNTSSVGAYVTFVRMRERLERWLGYRSASAIAALRLLLRVRSSHVRLEIEGDSRTVATPLVFVGVGERKLSAPRFGEPVRGGDRVLHLLVVNGRAPTRHLVRALAAAARGRDEVVRTPNVDSFLMEELVVELPLPRVRVALDGEVHVLRAPLRYRFAPDRLLTVTPPTEGRREATE